MNISKHIFVLAIAAIGLAACSEGMGNVFTGPTEGACGSYHADGKRVGCKFLDPWCPQTGSIAMDLKYGPYFSVAEAQEATCGLDTTSELSTNRHFNPNHKTYDKDGNLIE